MLLQGPRTGREGREAGPVWEALRQWKVSCLLSLTDSQVVTWFSVVNGSLKAILPQAQDGRTVSNHSGRTTRLGNLRNGLLEGHRRGGCKLPCPEQNRFMVYNGHYLGEIIKLTAPSKGACLIDYIVTATSGNFANGNA